jgi:hypothetical protein
VDLDRVALPGAHAVLGGRLPAPVTRPSLISRCSCERDCSGRTAVVVEPGTVAFGIDVDVGLGH